MKNGNTRQKKNKLPARTAKLLEAFDEAAQAHGRLREWGHPNEAAEALEEYEKAKEKLEAHLVRVFRRQLDPLFKLAPKLLELVGDGFTRPTLEVRLTQAELNAYDMLCDTPTYTLATEVDSGKIFTTWWGPSTSLSAAMAVRGVTTREVLFKNTRAGSKIIARSNGVKWVKVTE